MENRFCVALFFCRADSRRASRRCITGEVRFRDRLWSHPGHVSCLIGATPLSCLRTSSADALRLCKSVLISRPRFHPGRFIFPPRESFSFLRFFYSCSLFLPILILLRDRSIVSSFAIRSEDSRSPFFVSRYCEISWKEYAVELSVITEILNKEERLKCQNIKITYIFNYLKLAN